jgi:hypothetical protein
LKFWGLTPKPRLEVQGIDLNGGFMSGLTAGPNPNFRVVVINKNATHWQVVRLQEFVVTDPLTGDGQWMDSAAVNENEI